MLHGSPLAPRWSPRTSYRAAVLGAPASTVGAEQYKPSKTKSKSQVAFLPLHDVNLDISESTLFDSVRQGDLFLIKGFDFQHLFGFSQQRQRRPHPPGPCLLSPLSAGPFIHMANPFTLPSDEEVFKLRDAERKMKKIDREKQSSLRVWEKTTSTAQLSRSTKVSELLGEMGGDVDAVGLILSFVRLIFSNQHHRRLGLRDQQPSAHSWPRRRRICSVA